MKNIKDLKITTKEGFSVKNLQRFPSMEWGDEGGLQADLYYKGNLIARIYNEGNGGCANAYNTNLSLETKRAVIDFLNRCDSNYKKYDFLKNKKPKDIDYDDLEAVINCIEEQYDIAKKIKKSFKNGFKSVAILEADYILDFLQYRVDNVTIDEVKTYLKQKSLDKKYNTIKLYKCTDNLSVM